MAIDQAGTGCSFSRPVEGIYADSLRYKTSEVVWKPILTNPGAAKHEEHDDPADEVGHVRTPDVVLEPERRGKQ
jgi:hypothetical protein